MNDKLIVSAERDFATFLSRVHLMDLEFERPHDTPQEAMVKNYDAMTDWWRHRAAQSLVMEAGLRAVPEFTETELRIARRVQEKRAQMKRDRPWEHDGTVEAA
jgi:hypothetical protein